MFSEADDEYTGEYRIMEIAQDLLALLVEDFQIFLQWRADFDGPATARRQVLKAAIGGRDRVAPEKSKLMRLHFKRFAEFEFEVMWEPVDEAPR